MSTLYIVATPIGNLQDMTYRGVETLKSVDFVAAEDTRESRKLLSAFEIQKPLLSCRAANEKNSAAGLVKLLSEGKTIAYVTDAGTPGVSDPGAVLVRAVRDAGFPVVPIPGASAFSTIVSVCGFPGKTVTFDGFLAMKEGKRRKRLEELLGRKEAFVLYESPFRILKLLNELKDLDPGRKILLGREMTKNFEEFLEGTPEEVLNVLQQRPNIKGEFAVLVSGEFFD